VTITTSIYTLTQTRRGTIPLTTSLILWVTALFTSFKTLECYV